MTALDEVAWLTNLRGSDVDYNPVFTSYFLLTPEAATLYVSSSKANLNLITQPALRRRCIACAPSTHDAPLARVHVGLAVAMTCWNLSSS